MGGNGRACGLQTRQDVVERRDRLVDQRRTSSGSPVGRASEGLAGRGRRRSDAGQGCGEVLPSTPPATPTCMLTGAIATLVEPDTLVLTVKVVAAVEPVVITCWPS